jgi:hypothetical protein
LKALKLSSFHNSKRPSLRTSKPYSLINVLPLSAPRLQYKDFCNIFDPFLFILDRY